MSKEVGENNSEGDEASYEEARSVLIHWFTIIGAAIAVQISWGLNHSIGWAAWHGFLGWFYVAYRWRVGVY